MLTGSGAECQLRTLIGILVPFTLRSAPPLGAAGHGPTAGDAVRPLLPRIITN